MFVSENKEGHFHNSLLYRRQPVTLTTTIAFMQNESTLSLKMNYIC